MKKLVISLNILTLLGSVGLFTFGMLVIMGKLFNGIESAYQILIGGFCVGIGFLIFHHSFQMTIEIIRKICNGEED